MVDGAVFPAGEGGGEGGVIGVVRRGVKGEETPALAIAAVHLDLAHVEEFGISFPAPADVHPAAIHGGGEDRLDGGKIRRSFGGAENAQIGTDGFSVIAGILDGGDKGENAVQRAGFHGPDTGGQRGWRENRQHAKICAIARHGFGGGLGAGERPRTGGGQP